MAPNGWDYNTYTTHTITSTTAADNPVYYSIGANGEAVRIPMEHNHALPNHSHGNLSAWSMEPNINLSELEERIEKLESVLNELLGPQYLDDLRKIELRDKLLDNKPKEEEKAEHLDPDLFKV